MFTKNVKPQKTGKRGRPPGRTAQGMAAGKRLFDLAVTLISERGYEATTLRDIAAHAGVSVGLLYRYFPSKRAIVLALYDQLSADYASQASEMPPGRWRDRFIFALETSLGALRPHRNILKALVSVIVGEGDESLFSKNTAFSRLRVQKVFQDAVVNATDAPARRLAEAIGRLLYLLHLGVILWWLLDRSSQQRATRAFVSLLRDVLPSASLTLRVPPVRRFLQSVDELVQEALFEDVGLSTSD